MQILFKGFQTNTISAQLREGLTLNDFLLTAQQALGFRTLEEAGSFHYILCNKSLDVKRESAFDLDKRRISQGCVIIVMVRLLGGYTLSEILDSIAKQELFMEMEKDFAQWFIEKDFKIACTVCWKPIQPETIFKTPAYIATLQALEDEKQLLQNIDCQRCNDCQVLMVNESMFSQQVCVVCRRAFCFFCNRPWNALKMQNPVNTCGKECVYETMLSFRLKTFHYLPDMKIPSQRTCPQCLNLGAYDEKCKYHSCTVCKFSFCLICLKEKQHCERHSAYNELCVQTPVLQDYSMSPRLLA
ncbi:unnamed protein product [Mortierella alpina]